MGESNHKEVSGLGEYGGPETEVRKERMKTK